MPKKRWYGMRVCLCVPCVCCIRWWFGFIFSLLTFLFGVSRFFCSSQTTNFCAQMFFWRKNKCRGFFVIKQIKKLLLSGNSSAFFRPYVWNFYFLHYVCVCVRPTHRFVDCSPSRAMSSSLSHAVFFSESSKRRRPTPRATIPISREQQAIYGFTIDHTHQSFRKLKGFFIRHNSSSYRQHTERRHGFYTQ